LHAAVQSGVGQVQRGPGSTERISRHEAEAVAMIKRAPPELPPEIARRFFEDMRVFHRERNAIKRDEIAGRQLHALAGYLRPRDRKLRLSDIKELFEQMRDWRKRKGRRST
jgi:hypothetical protein